MKYLLIFGVSMLPLVEIRGAVPIALSMDMPLIPVMIVCVLGNMLPVPIIYFFARKFLIWGAGRRYIGGMCRFFLEKGEKAGQKLVAKTGRGGLALALLIFVGIPLPGTGAWTGTLGASFLNMGPKSTTAAVCLGVIMSGAIMTVISLLGLHILGF